MNLCHQMRLSFRLRVTLGFVSLLTLVSTPTCFSQDIRYEDRIGSNKAYDMCEDFRFQRITKLVQEGKLPAAKGYNIWKRIQSDKEAVGRVLDASVAGKELTRDQADRLLPLIDADMVYFDSQHGRFGKPKVLTEGQFEKAEVSAVNRRAVYKRLIAANDRCEIYDYDVASIMNQLYAGFEEGDATPEEIAEFRGALNPRIAQSGSQARVLQSVQMQKNRSMQKGYGTAEIKITDPDDWTKSLEKPIFSGPQPGESLTALTVVNMRGDSAGNEFDPLELAGDKLHLVFFVSRSRTFGRFIGQLANQLKVIEQNSKQPWAISVIVCTDDYNEAQKSFAILDERYPQNVVVALCKDGAAGPPAYGLDKHLTATVLAVKNRKVVHNFAYASDAFYTQPNILGAVSSLMDVDHDALRRYLSGAPGDEATQAAGRYRRVEP